MATILIAEDDPHIARVVTLWLKRNGHEVTVATSGDKALAALRENRADLVVTDVNMPVMDGLEFLTAAREEFLLKHRAIVLTSRCDQSEIAARAAELGAVVHPKPFSPMQLTEAIEQSLAEPINTDGMLASVIESATPEV